MNSIVDFIRTLPDVLSLKGASEAEIAQAESALGTSFAQEYRDYVSVFGSIAYSGHELTGVCASPRLNVVNATQLARIVNPHIPAEYYVVEDCGIDGILIWQSPCGEILQTFPNQPPKNIAPALKDYLLARSRS